MGYLADQFDRIRVRVRAPGAEIEAELRNYTEISLSFDESVYEFISESALDQELARMARLLHAGWVRQYRAVLDGTAISIDPKDRHDRNFIEERSGIEVSGSSHDERVALSTKGMNEFSAKVERGTVRDLKEKQFTTDVAEAVSDLFEKFRRQASEIHERYYP